MYVLCKYLYLYVLPMDLSMSDSKSILSYLILFHYTFICYLISLLTERLSNVIITFCLLQFLYFYSQKTLQICSKLKLIQQSKKRVSVFPIFVSFCFYNELNVNTFDVLLRCNFSTSNADSTKTKQKLTKVRHSF